MQKVNVNQAREWKKNYENTQNIQHMYMQPTILIVTLQAAPESSSTVPARWYWNVDLNASANIATLDRIICTVYSVFYNQNPDTINFGYCRFSLAVFGFILLAIGAK